MPVKSVALQMDNHPMEMDCLFGSPNPSNDRGDIYAIVLEPQLDPLLQVLDHVTLGFKSGGRGFNGVASVNDAGDRTGFANGVKGLEGVPALIDKKGEGHRGTTVDTHMAVHHYDGVVMLEGLVECGNAVVEPLVILIGAIVVGAQIVVMN